MANIQLKFTPPRKGSPSANCSPQAWLKSEIVTAKFNAAHIPLSTEEQQFDIMLDPQNNSEDTDIMSDYEQTSTLLPIDRRKIAVTLPASNLDTRDLMPSAYLY